MSDEDEKKREEERFPAVPRSREAPAPPKLDVKLPPHPSTPRTGAVEPGAYNKMAIATTAATSFIMPVILLSVGGYFLDQKLHTSPWLAFGGVVVGFVTGIVALMRVMRKLSD
jgi:hypothetical protein